RDVAVRSVASAEGPPHGPPERVADERAGDDVREPVKLAVDHGETGERRNRVPRPGDPAHLWRKGDERRDERHDARRMPGGPEEAAVREGMVPKVEAEVERIIGAAEGRESPRVEGAAPPAHQLEPGDDDGRRKEGLQAGQRRAEQ